MPITLKSLQNRARRALNEYHKAYDLAVKLEADLDAALEARNVADRKHTQACRDLEDFKTLSKRVRIGNKANKIMIEVTYPED